MEGSLFKEDYSGTDSMRIQPHSTTGLSKNNKKRRSQLKRDRRSWSGLQAVQTTLP